MRVSEANKITDRIIGSRIAAFRIAKGWSRQKLGNKIGVTHQQIQKYEKGMNSLRPGRLFLIARTLNKTVDELCGDITKDTRPESPSGRLGLELSKNFALIEDAKQQVSINALVRSMVPNKL